MTTRIVTDGASRGNPGPGGWAALIVRDDQVEEIGGHELHTTNNRMELRAAIEGLQRVAPDEAVEIVTDSQYLRRGLTEWLPAWQRRGWKTASGAPVENQDLWRTLAGLAGQRVSWQQVRGHAGHPENERADAIATAYAQGKAPPPPPASLEAPAADPAAEAFAAQVQTRRPAKKTYLSLVGDQLMRHTAWEDCRLRVHGVRGARYKKCTSAADEIATVQAWGLSVEQLLHLD